MSAVFNVASFAYEQSADAINARVTRVDAERNLDDAFEITIDFTKNASSIRDITADDVFEYDHLYRANVLAAFQSAFDQAYAAVSHDASPADVQLTNFSVAL